MFYEQFPAGYLWEFPGIYSISVPYGMQNNFFFCGHVGLAMICGCEFFSGSNYKMAVFCFLTMICQSALLLFLRGHYSIDILIAIFFGHYFWLQAERISYLIDYKILGIPFHKRFPNFTQKCGWCKYPINQWINIGQEYKND
jgi:hypothetical protein